MQFGLPIAAGALLPLTNTMLTPSIAGALMGMSSLAVMANSLLLRLEVKGRRRRSGGLFDSKITRGFGIQAGRTEGDVESGLGLPRKEGKYAS